MPPRAEDGRSQMSLLETTANNSLRELLSIIRSWWVQKYTQHSSLVRVEFWPAETALAVNVTANFYRSGLH